MGWYNRYKLKCDIQERMLSAELKVAEAINLNTKFVNPEDALKDPVTGEIWNALGSPTEGGINQLLDTQRKLDDVRAQMRLLALKNEFAINGHENRISYVVGTGHSYTVAGKKNEEVADEQIEVIQDVLDEFIDESKWQKRQQEIMLRKDRDGEAFLRFFVDGDRIAVRFIEPGLVRRPENDNRDNATFGIVTVPNDVETVVGYMVDGEQIDAGEIQHRKSNVDFNVKRGVPLFFPVQKNLVRIEGLLKNMSVTASIQAAIAMIRKHASTGQASVQSYVQSAADVQNTNDTLGKTFYHKAYNPGTILDAPQSIEYEFPSHGVDASKLVIVIQAELRAVAARLTMPEFMFSSDASNANYSSTMVAEGPAVKMFERLQWDMIVDDLEVMNHVLTLAIERGRISQDTVDKIQIVPEPPPLESRDRLKEVQADGLLIDKRVLSKHTAQLRHDLDPDVEEARIKEERDASDPMGELDFDQQVQLFGKPAVPADDE